jgi:galactokinase
MVNNSDYSFLKDTAFPTIGIKNISDRGRHANKERRRIFLESMDETVRHLYNHPSICYWTIFNEGWGQFCADDAYDRLKALDSTRFIDSTSGWFHQNKSDVDSYHVYFKKIDLTAGDRPLVLSEFGGYACKLMDHCFNRDKTYGYRKCANEAALLEDMGKLYNDDVLPMIEKGLSASIYTQVSDVEDETNGLLTYDRDILKFKSYVGTGRIEIIGNHTDHQGGRVLVAPTPNKIKAYVAENHRDAIRIVSEGFTPFEVSLTDRKNFEKGTTAAIVMGILEGFVDLFGPFEGSGNGFDVHIKSDVPVGSGLSSSAAFEILLCRIINDRYFGGKADAVQIAKIAMFAEREFYGKPCGMMDQLAISLGRMAMIDFSGKEPEIELIDFDFDEAGYDVQIIMTEDDHAELDAEYASVPDDMFKVAEALGVSRLGDINEEQFMRSLPELEKKVKAGELTSLQVDRARHFFNENERVLAGTIAIKTGNYDRFISCINESGLSSETLLRNIVPPGVSENSLSRTLAEYRAKPDTAAVKLEGGGFGGSVLVIKRK